MSAFPLRFVKIQVPAQESISSDVRPHDLRFAFCSRMILEEQNGASFWDSLSRSLDRMTNFTYGDSCQTGDDKYVIAQFPSDASLSWVLDLRSFLNVAELKYKTFEPRLYHVQSKPDLWKRVLDGVYHGEITITDPRVYKRAVFFTWYDQGAEWRIDFDERTVNEEAAEWMIGCSPLRIADRANIDWRFENPDSDDIIDFTPSGIKERAGGKFTDAIVVSTRAHAMLNPAETRQLIDLCTLSSGANYATGLAQVARLCRIWDIEHPKSLPILNDFSDRIGSIISTRGRHFFAGRTKPAVSEEVSHSSDHLQAADMAAGWAAHLLTLSGGDYRSLARQFISVCVNGVVYPG